VKKGAIFFVLILFLLFHADAVSAQTQRDWWYTLERGKLMFRQGDYGNALLAFEDARRQRRVVYERLERNLINLLSIIEVRRIGDSLDLVERYIQERRYADAAAALAELYYRIPKETFNNSAFAALAALSSLKDYPEAEYWIGETYLVEGELSLAQSQFQKAYALRGLLENPGFATELLYKIAAICQVRQDYREMERTLLLILSADKLWSGGNQQQEAGITSSAPFETQSMTRTLENNGINRFLTLYRYRSAESVDAHRLLGFYYYTSGRHSRAQEHLMFAFLIQNTVIIEEVIRNRFDFTFTTLEALAIEINRYPLLTEYAAKNEYYKTAYYLGASLYANGKAATARELWNFLAAQNNAGEWRTRSLTQLSHPHVERSLEMP
jgi:tetratricopeptide (TPR) repeat protein